MPQFDSYPAIAELASADLILVYRNDVGAVKTISSGDFAASMKALISRAMEITELNASTSISDEEYIVGNSGAAFTLTLPPTTTNPGQPIFISNKGSGAINFTPDGTDTIIGQPSLSVAQYESRILVPDGLGMWHVFSQ